MVGTKFTPSSHSSDKIDQGTMENVTLKETSDFASYDPYWYVDNYMGTDEAAFNMGYDLDKFHKMFTDYGVHGKRLLDIGTGSTIHTVISATEFVEEIYLSDFAKRNIEYLEKWHKGEITQPPKIIEHVIRLEGRKLDANQREKEVREKVKGIFHIDVTSEQPLGSHSQYGTFDVIMASYCLEVAANTVENYQKCLENVSSLLKPGGFLIIACCVEGDSYRVGDYKYPALFITEKQFKNAITQAGFEAVVYMEDFPGETDNKNMTFTSYHYALAKKN